MMELVIEFILIYVLSFPGAFIRWLFIRKRRPFKDLLKDSWYYNAGITVFVSSVIVAIVLLSK